MQYERLPRLSSSLLDNKELMTASKEQCNVRDYCSRLSNHKLEIYAVQLTPWKYVFYRIWSFFSRLKNSWRFISGLTEINYWALPWVSSFSSVSLRSILIVSSHLCVGLAKTPCSSTIKILNEIDNISNTPHPSCYNCPNNITWVVQILNLIM